MGVTGTGECAVMSLVRMDVSSENGSIDPSSSCFWGGVGHDIEGLQNYTQAFCVANMSANFGTSQVAQNSRDLTGMVPMLPSDIYDTDIKNPYAPDGMNSYGPNSNIAYLGPSPYLSDMKFNALVKNTNPSSSCYSDFDGKGNTEKILQDDYVHQIVNASSIFRTEGTNPGDWYVPSAGEILYLVARYKKIMETMVSLKTSGYRCLPIYINQTFHTSTEYNADYMVHLYIYDTFCEISASWGKSSRLETRGFIRV